MERQVIYRNRQEVTTDDLNNPQVWGQEANDHIVRDGIEPGRKFVGLQVTQATASSVAVAAGRIYFDGRVHYTAGGALDLNALRPNLQRRVVAIVAWPETVDVDIQERDFEIDAEEETVEASAVAMERRRNARLEAVAGVEAVAPQNPVIEATAVVVAYVTMSPAGIEAGGIATNTAAQLRSLRDVDLDVGSLKEFQTVTAPRVSTLQSDLAKLAAESRGAGERSLLFDVASDVAILKAALDVPDTYVGYRADRFLDDSQSDDAFAGYAARIEEGLRFPFAAQDDMELALLNPYLPTVDVSEDGLLLPAYAEVEDRVIRGQAGEISLAQYASEMRTLTRLEMSRSRIRFGGDFEISTNSAFWLAGSYEARLNGYTGGTFRKDGEVFQTYETGKVDPDGNKIVRLARYWTDTTAAPYWARVTTEENVLGYAHVETFLNVQDRWITSLGPHITRKPAAGGLTVGVCETYRGEPDLDRIVAMVTIQPGDLAGVAGQGGFVPKIAIEPTFLEGGKRYGLFVVTAADWWIGVTDAQVAGVTGAYFYGMNGGVWNQNPGAHLIWRLWSAKFDRTNVDVDLQALNLAGGIQLVDVLAESVIPASTDLVFSAQIGGVWRQLDEADPGIFAGLPALVPFRVSFIGTPDVMPGVRLPGSVVKFARLATVGKHASDVKNLAANANTITETIRLRDFDAAHNTLTVSIIRAGPVTEAADLVEDVVQPDGTIERTVVFNLGAATNSYRRVIDYTTDSPLRPFTVFEATSVAV